mgnify:CR=1 FL=1
MAVYVFTETENGDLNLSDQYAYASEIRCSFDPNDKLTLPNRNGDENYTLFGEELEYTIRFQNTGNDVAFDVVIKDQLDQNLDWSTFRPISGSHEFATHFYEETGVIEFIFENIFLPPSNMDEAGSQGYVKFTIKAKTDLAENTLVENDAAIYFDLNPPIYTNTVQNTMVYELPVINQTANEKPGLEINIFPNPFDQTFTIRIEGDGSRHDYHFRLRDSMGRLVQTGQWKNQSVHQVQTHNLSAGLYFIEIMEKSGQGIFSGKLVKK